MEIKPDKKLMTKRWYGLLTFTFFALLVAVIVQIFVPLDPELTHKDVAVVLWPIFITVNLLTYLISVPIMKLWIKNLTYYIEEDKITIHKGILSKIKQHIPFRAVTDFRLHRSLYDRFLGIGSIQVQTAGQSQSASGFEGQLSGLSEYDKLLQELRGKLDKLHPVSEATTVREPESSPLKEDSLRLILEELKAIRKALESK
jgi:uncharacterized membrane protein YdbT with pleckstrin-like domain